MNWMKTKWQTFNYLAFWTYVHRNIIRNMNSLICQRQFPLWNFDMRQPVFTFRGYILSTPNSTKSHQVSEPHYMKSLFKKLKEETVDRQKNNNAIVCAGG